MLLTNFFEFPQVIVANPYKNLVNPGGPTIYVWRIMGYSGCARLDLFSDVFDEL